MASERVGKMMIARKKSLEKGDTYDPRADCDDEEILREYHKLVSSLSELDDLLEDDSQEDGPEPPQIPGYEVHTFLAKGGMGEVWQATELSLDREVALKIFGDSYLSGATAEDFQFETLVAAKLDHPSIVPVYAHGITEGRRPYFTMKLVRGPVIQGVDTPPTTLADLLRIRTDGAGRRSHLLEVFNRVCEAVKFAHSKNVIHYDLKPANVLLGEHGEVLVTDWGIAKLVDRDIIYHRQDGLPESAEAGIHGGRGASANDTDSPGGDTWTKVAGTPKYMSPEQARGQKNLIAKPSDVFSLGKVLCEILEGPSEVQDSQQTKNESTTRVDHQQADPENSDTISTKLKKFRVDDELIAIAVKCLCADPKERYQDAGGLTEAIRSYRANVEARLRQEQVEFAEAKVKATADLEKQQIQIDAKRKRQLALLRAAGTLLIVVAGFGVVMYWLWIESEGHRRDAEGANTTLVKEQDKTKQALDETTYQLGISNLLLGKPTSDHTDDLSFAAQNIGKVPKNQRKWEWHYLSQRLQGGTFGLFGHTKTVNAAQFSSDESRIITVGSDCTVRLWDAESGECIRVMAEHKSEVNCVSLSQKANFMATGDRDGIVKLWDQKKCLFLSEFKAHANGVRDLFFSPDGTRLVTLGGAYGDYSVRIWNTGKLSEFIEIKNERAGDISCIANLLGDSRFAICTYRGQVKIHDIASGKQQATLDVRGDAAHVQVENISFSPDGTQILVGNRQGFARVWEVKTGRMIVELANSQSAESMSFSPDARTIVGRLYQQTRSVLWDTATGSIVARIGLGVSTVSFAAFSPKGTRLLVGRYGGSIALVNVDSGDNSLTVFSDNSRVLCAAFNKTGSQFATGGSDGSARIYDTKTGKCLHDIPLHEGGIHSIAFSPDGLRLGTASADETVSIWDLRVMKSSIRVDHDAPVTSVAFSPDGLCFASCSPDDLPSIRDLATGKLILQLREPEGGAWSVAFSPDGTTIATGGVDCVPKVWDAKNGSLIRKFEGHSGRVTHVAYNHDGSQIATSSADMSTRVWDVGLGTQIANLYGYGSTQASFNPDCSRLVTAGSVAGKAIVWDIRTGTPLLELHKSDYNINSASFSPDGNCILTGGDDMFAILHEADPSNTFKIFTASDTEFSIVRHASISSDGSIIAIDSTDNYIRAWDTNNDSLLFANKVNNRVKTLAFLADGQGVLAQYENGQSSHWDTATGAVLGDVSRNNIHHSRFSRDKSFFVLAHESFIAHVSLRSNADEAKKWYARYLSK